MHPFQYQRAASPSAAIDIAGRQAGGPPTLAAIQYLAGGTTILDLMKLDTMRPLTLIDINGFDAGYAEIRADAKGLHLGALARMADVAHDAAVLRDDENQPFVYLAAGSNQFGRRSVEIGESQNGQTQILKGLSVGDKVVGNGSLFLQFANSFQQ